MPSSLYHGIAAFKGAISMKTPKDYQRLFLMLYALTNRVPAKLQNPSLTGSNTCPCTNLHKFPRRELRARQAVAQ